jgi:hypothetical protein
MRAEIELENNHLRLGIGGDARFACCRDKRTGQDYLDPAAAGPFARLKCASGMLQASTVKRVGDRLMVTFGAGQASAVIRAEVRPDYLVFEVIAVSAPDAQELTFLDIRLRPDCSAAEDRFAACAIALNLATLVPEPPRAQSALQASCFSRFGLPGARAAVVGCPWNRMRAVWKEVLTVSADLPRSELGGPWALDAPVTRGSYLFTNGKLDAQTADAWIGLAKRLGFTQFDLGGSVRYGDIEPNLQRFPGGKPELKAVIDRIHAAGMAVSLHTYSFFMDKQCDLISPIPYAGLGAFKMFTLAEDLSAESATVPVAESTDKITTTMGFCVANSVSLQIDNEILIFGGARKAPPYAFTDCQRGAYGTAAATHARGAPVRHIKEYYGGFAPDPDSNLFTEVAARTAATCNECGFDIIYFDASDAIWLLAGHENSWYYWPKFVCEVWRRLKRPVMLEHEPWYLLSRRGAMDTPIRDYKKFIDLHAAGNAWARDRFIPEHLGWWINNTWVGAQGDRTFADDIEYLCGKCIGYNCGFSLMGIEPDTIDKIPAFAALAEIIRRYETVRLANSLPAPLKARLRQAGEEFALVEVPNQKPRLRPMQYARHKVGGLDGSSDRWVSHNKFGAQPVRLRLEALLSAAAYDDPDGVVLADFASPKEFGDREAAEGVALEIQPSRELVKAGGISGRLTARNSRTDRQGAWAGLKKTFTEPLDLRGPAGRMVGGMFESGHSGYPGAPQGRGLQVLGVWVHGDGKGELLNFRLRSPDYSTWATGDHYVLVDFTGWRYCELVEPEGERNADYVWPSLDLNCYYRESVDYERVASLSLWCNNLPPGEGVECFVSPVKALPLEAITLRDPAITVNGQRLVFPVEIESGCYLEFQSPEDCQLYGRKGELLRAVKPQGAAPVLAAGANQLQFDCRSAGKPNPRARVTVISRGELL